MKNVISTLLMSFCLVASISAQKVLDQGFLKLEITEVSSDDEQTAAMLQMMKGSQTEIYFKDHLNMSSMNMMGGMVQVKVLADKKVDKVDMLMDMMGQKMHIESSKAEMEKATEDQADMYEGFKVEYDDKDVKDILGHQCIKAKVIDPKTNKSTVEMYVARGIKADAKLIQGLQYFEVDGFPLEVIMIQPQMTMTMTTVELKEEVSDDSFKINSDGYQKLTFQEFMDKMSAMGGGGGFGF